MHQVETVRATVRFTKGVQAVETVKREGVYANGHVDACVAAKLCNISLSQFYKLARQGKAPPPHPQSGKRPRAASVAFKAPPAHLRRALIDVMMWSVHDLIKWLRRRAVERPAQAGEINQVLSAIREETIEKKKWDAEFAKIQEARRRVRAAEMTAADHEAIALLKRLGLGDGIDFYSI